MQLSKLIGNTPLVKINDKIYAKLETYNPSGSIKDRMAHYILTQARKNKTLKPGDTIVEATSGNTGIAMSMLGAAMPSPLETNCVRITTLILIPASLATSTIFIVTSIRQVKRLLNKRTLFLPSSLALALVAP